MSSKRSVSRKSKTRDSDQLPDQYLFINKSADSESLSNSNAGERFYIHSHVHSKHHKEKRQQKAKPSSKDEESPNKSPNTGQIFCWQSDSPDKTSSPVEDDKDHRDARSDSVDVSIGPSWNKLILQDSVDTLSSLQGTSSSTTSPAYNASDENAANSSYTAAAPIDEKDQRLLSFVYTHFIKVVLKAKPSAFSSDYIAANQSRLGAAISGHSKDMVIDPLIMFTTLSYCASSRRWASGVSEDERPPEFYMVRAIEALRPRLQNRDEVAPYLLQAIYALAVSEMWSHNYQPATTHLIMIRHLVLKAGGFSRLKPHVKEGLLLCDKYTAIGNLAKPVFYLDWKPDELPAAQLQQIHKHVRSFLPNIARGFFSTADDDDDDDEDLVGEDLQMIVRDIVACVSVAVYSRIQTDSDPTLQRWLFLQHQFLTSRLLVFEPENQTQRCVRMALIIWLLRITTYFGAQRWSRWLLPRFRDELMALKAKAGKEAAPPLDLVFWMLHLGSLTAEEAPIRGWFLRQTLEIARGMEVEVGREAFSRVLERYLFLKSEAGIRFERVLNTLGQIN